MQLISQHDSAAPSTRAVIFVRLCFIRAIKSQLFRQSMWGPVSTTRGEQAGNHSCKVTRGLPDKQTQKLQSWVQTCSYAAKGWIMQVLRHTES